MSTTRSKSTLKHKLPNDPPPLSKKKPRFSSPQPTCQNDSGIGNSVSCKKKVLVRKAKNPVTRRQLKIGEVDKSIMNEQADSGIGTSQGSISTESMDVDTNLSLESQEPIPKKMTKKRVQTIRRASKIDTDKDSKDSSSKSRKTSAKRAAAKKSEPVELMTSIADMDVSQILALGEGTSLDSTKHRNNSESDSDDTDWEEVSEAPKLAEPVIPSSGVDITLPAPSMSFKRKKREFDLEGEIRRQLNRRQKEIQELMHKVHLLCWIAHCKFVNSVLNSEDVLKQCHDGMSSKNYYPPKHADIKYLERIAKIFARLVTLDEKVVDTTSLKESLCVQFEKKTAYSKHSMVLMFVVFLRSLGLKTRFVVSFVTVPLKPSSKVNIKCQEKCKSSPDTVKPKLDSSKISNDTTKKNLKESAIAENQGISLCKKTSPTVHKVRSVRSLKDNLKKNLESSSVKNLPQRSSKRNVKPEAIDTDSEEEVSKYFVKDTSKKKQVASNTKSLPNRSLKDKLKKNLESPSIRKLPQRSLKKNVKTEAMETESEEVSKYFVNGKSNLIKNLASSKLRKLPQRMKAGKKQVKTEQSETDSEEELSKYFVDVKKEESSVAKPSTSRAMDVDSDEDFSPPKKSPIVKKKIDRRVLSTDDEADNVGSKKKGLDVWVEVFLEAEEKWISVDVTRQKVHCVQFLYTRATQPVAYVIACNSDSTLKDVTKRYVPHWHSDTRKKRVAEDWWTETMWPYLPPDTPQNREEDEDIARQLHDMPLPKSISEYKAHPLYALTRHLLKFEGIYPPDAPTLGFVRGEPVYGRECVVTLRSREIWFKEARVVRPNETCYKIVKSRPKYDKMTGDFKKDLPLELFGVWQTEDYVPPTAVNGQVPRNEYGNVDLFKPCMIPFGTVHLQIPALNRVARKLGIDCAPAVVGFDFHSGGSHPVHDGFVVCEEFKDQLLEAWNKEIDESAKRAEEKREKRVYGNWRRLIRGLLIRENLKIKYAFGENDDDDDEQVPSTSEQKEAKKSGRKMHKK